MDENQDRKNDQPTWRPADYLHVIEREGAIGVIETEMYRGKWAVELTVYYANPFRSQSQESLENWLRQLTSIVNEAKGWASEAGADSCEPHLGCFRMRW